jgi:hypothetical protein
VIALLGNVSNTKHLFLTVGTTIFAISTFIFVSLRSIEMTENDWYLAYQLVDLSRATLKGLTVLPYVGFYNPMTGTHDLFGYQTYSMGMLIFSPDSIFFPLFSTRQAITFHIAVTLLFVCGLLHFQLGKYKLSQFSMLFLLLNIVFAVPVIARLSEGHLQLLGYYLIPSFILLIKSFDSSLLWFLKITLLLTYVLSLGSTHVFFQMSILLFFVGVFQIQTLIRLVLPPLFALLLTAFQTLPSVFAPHFVMDRQIGHGYGYLFNKNILEMDSVYKFDSVGNSFSTIIFHIMEIINHLANAMLRNNFAIQKEGWEWTLYFPLTNLLLLILVLFVRRKASTGAEKKFGYLIISGVLSVSMIYHFIWLLIPFQAIDRVPFRMMLYPFFAILIYLAFHLDEVITRVKNTRLRNFLKVFVLVSCGYSLMIASFDWFDRLNTFSATPTMLNSLRLPRFEVIATASNPAYERFLSVGFLVTLLSWLVLMYFVFRIKKLAQVKELS